MMRSSISRPRKRDLSHYAVFRSKLCSPPSSKSPMVWCFRGVLWKGIWMLRLCGSPSLCHSRAGWGRGQAMTPLPGFIGILYIDALQSYAISVERHFSRIPPAFPRPLASVLSRARRHSALCFALRAPSGSGFPNKNLPRDKRAAMAQRAGEIFLRTLHRKRAFGLGSGAHSRRFA
jgi:hypothetical protein